MLIYILKQLQKQQLTIQTIFKTDGAMGYNRQQSVYKKAGATTRYDL